MAERRTGMRVGRLRLRLPGTSAESGREVAARVTQRLAALSPPVAGRPIGALRIRQRAAAGQSPRETADAVAAAIGRRLAGGSDA